MSSVWPLGVPEALLSNPQSHSGSRHFLKKSVRAAGVKVHLISGVDVMGPVLSAVPEERTPPLPALSLPPLCLLLPPPRSRAEAPSLHFHFGDVCWECEPLLRG